MMNTAAEFVLNTLRTAGFEAYLVGGCVRDFLLQRPIKDFDITTNARPEQVVPLFEKTIPIGAAFGVVVVMVEGIQLEVATFRADGVYSDGRRPDGITYSDSAEADVTRRDFTMNGLLMGNDPSITCVVDYVGGKADIAAKLIRCIGNPHDRFSEDALRMLRAVRFAAQLNFHIESNTLEAIRQNAHLITNVSRERIREELFKLVASPYPMYGLIPLVSTGLFRHIFPALTESMNFSSTLERFSLFPTNDPLLGMAMLLADTTTDEMLTQVLDSLKLPSKEFKIIENAVIKAADVGLSNSFDDASIKKLAREPGVLPYAVDLYEQTLGTGLSNDGMEYGMTTVLRFRNLDAEDIYPTPLVTGKDLIAMGMTPSPVFCRILEAVEYKQLNEELVTREDALAFVADEFQREVN